MQKQDVGKWIDEHQMHQPKLVAAQTPLVVLNTILFYFFHSFIFFEQEFIVFSLSFDPYTSFLLTFVTNTARLSTKGAHKDQLRWMAHHKNKKLGWGICGGQKTRVGWVGTCSKRFDDQNKDNNQNDVEKKKNSATRQILKD